jgi:hypothetical protein
MGKRGFFDFCASFHDVNAQEQEQEGVAPPLVHKIYKPNHNCDIAFIPAAQNTVMGHHWPSVDMPAVEGIAGAKIRDIIAYVRSLQREAAFSDSRFLRPWASYKVKCLNVDAPDRFAWSVCDVHDCGPDLPLVRKTQDLYLAEER